MRGVTSPRTFSCGPWSVPRFRIAKADSDRSFVQLPGITTPLSTLPIILLALLSAQTIHEIGHALAAASSVASLLLHFSPAHPSPCLQRVNTAPSDRHPLVSSPADILRLAWSIIESDIASKCRQRPQDRVSRSLAQYRVGRCSLGNEYEGIRRWRVYGKLDGYACGWRSCRH